jgi:DNA recombination protein RmuC
MQLGILIAIVVGATVGLLVGWFLRGQRSLAKAAADEVLLSQLRQADARLQNQLEEALRERDTARERVAALTAQLEAERTAARDKLETLENVEKRMKEAFGAVAVEALDANSQRLLNMSKGELAKQNEVAQRDLGDKELSIANMLRPMKESLQQLTQHSQQLEVQREGAYKAILAEVENIQRSQIDLRKETTQLVQALRAPKVRGNWGEMQLRRCVEHAGMVEHASFDVEKFVRGDDRSVRPDLIVRLPNERCIVIDAKTPLDAFMSAGACEDEVARHAFLGDHAAAVRKHLDALASKAYWNRFKDSPDFVVCFLPSEVLFSAALEQDPTLLEHSANTKVLLATPTTLIALLKAVAYGWQQAQTTKDADRIKDVALKLYEKFVGFHDSLLSIGSALTQAGSAYDQAVNRAEGHGGLFSIARKLKDMKIGEKEIAEGRPIALLPRQMQHPDWQSSLALAASESDDSDV